MPLHEDKKRIIKQYIFSPSADATVLNRALIGLNLNEIKETRKFILDIENQVTRNLSRGFKYSFTSMSTSLLIAFIAATLVDAGFRGFKFFNPTAQHKEMPWKILVFGIALSYSMSCFQNQERMRRNQIKKKISSINAVLNHLQAKIRAAEHRVGLAL